MTKARDLANVGSVAAGGLTFRNRFINGNAAIQQRPNLVLAAIGNTYAVDRWITGITTGAGISVTCFTSGFGGSSSGKGVYIAGSYTNGTPYFAQRIESVNTQDLNSQNVTISGLLFHDTGSTQTIVLRLVKPSATDNYTSASVVASKTVTFPSGVVTPFSWTVALGSSDATNGLQFDLYTSTGITVTSKNFAISDMQFEKGTVQQAFEWRPYSTELALCQRYCFGQNTAAAGSPSAYYSFGNSYGVASTAAFGVVTFPVTMRQYPSVTISAASSFGLGTGSGYTTVAIDQVSKDSGCLYFTGGSGATAGYGGRFLQNNTTAAYIIWSAEL